MDNPFSKILELRKQIQGLVAENAQRKSETSKTNKSIKELRAQIDEIYESHSEGDDNQN